MLQTFKLKRSPFSFTKVIIFTKIKIFLDKILVALKSLIRLVEHFPHYFKTHTAKLQFFNYWLKLDAAKRLESVGGDERLLSIVQSEIDALGCPTDVKNLEQLNEDFLKSNTASLRHVHEYIKLRQRLFNETASAKFEELALVALTQDKQQNDNVKAAANTHRRLLKSGSAGDKFQAKAKELYKYSEYFHKEASKAEVAAK
jgi:hypothetical protein